MEIWQYVLIAIGGIALLYGVYLLIKKIFQVITRVHHLNLRKKGLKEMPAVPFSLTETLETVVKLGLRTEECKMAKAGLSNLYTLHNETHNAYTFMYDKASHDPGKNSREELISSLKSSNEKSLLNHENLNKQFSKSSFNKEAASGEVYTKFFLEHPEQFSMSWTNYYNIYQDNYDKHAKEYASVITDTNQASEQFWPMIAENGLAYNLLFLQKVNDSNLNQIKKTFLSEWETYIEPTYKNNALYAIDLTIFSKWGAEKAAGFDRWTPGAFILLEQDKNTKKLQPISVRIAGKNDENAKIYTRKDSNTTDSAWIFALMAARTAVTVYGIWLGHVYHWHMVSAAMQMTLFNNVDKDHDLRKLLDPQSKSLIGFNDTLLRLWSTIGPPTSFTTQESFLELTNAFATGREFFDDDPIVALNKLGISKEDFTVSKDWDQYPIVGHLLYFWEASKEMVDVFVDVTYQKDDTKVYEDTQLQNWIRESTNPEEGNIRGLPVVGSTKELKRVLTSIVYRVVAHGNSRMMRSLGPGLSFVSNYPPCLQHTKIPKPSDTLDLQTLMRYLPNTGTIGSMMTFYYIFIFSAPYEPLIPLFGIDTNLYFEDKDDPRNKALITFRMKIEAFIKKYNKNAPLVHQWPASIET